MDKSQQKKLQTFALPILSLAISLFIGRLGHASPQPEDIFRCTRALYDADLLKEDQHRAHSGKGRSFRIASVPVDQPAQAYVISLGKLWHTREGHLDKRGAFGSGIAVVTREGLNCHRLVHPATEHGAGNIYETFGFKIAYPYSATSASFDVVVRRDGDSKRFLDSKVTRPDRHSSEDRQRLKPHSCLDPDGVELKRVLHELARMTDLHTHDLKSETKARRDIRRHVDADEPGPAFEPGSDLIISRRARLACRRIANHELRASLDRYEHAADRLDENDGDHRHRKIHHHVR